eukprot:6473642-Amphidinium_carterae.1
MDGYRKEDVKAIELDDLKESAWRFPKLESSSRVKNRWTMTSFGKSAKKRSQEGDRALHSECGR